MLRYITFPGSSSKPMSPGEPGLFSEMVSVPTSGKQIKDERETFKNFLQAINLMPRVAEQQDTASTFSVSTRLRYIHVHQVDGGFDNLANKGKGSGKSRVGNEDKRKGRRQVSEETKHWLYVQYFCQQRSLRKLIRCFLDPVPVRTSYKDDRTVPKHSHPEGRFQNTLIFCSSSKILPKHCFYFPLDLCKSQEKMETLFMQSKSIMVVLKVSNRSFA